MPVILPFRAFHSSSSAFYVPGEEPPLSLGDAPLVQDGQPALFLYHQRFRFPGESSESFRHGVMGLLNRAEATVFPHEETFPDRVSACADMLQSAGSDPDSDPDSDPGSLWLWCDDAEGRLAPLLTVSEAADIEATDRFGCLHQIWRVADPRRIRDLQSSLDAKSLFLADGHHRFAAGWNLATIQLRSNALRSLPSHRLVIAAGNLQLPATQPVEKIERYLASAPAGYWRAVVVTRSPVFRGVEVSHDISMKSLIGDATIQPIREIPQAIAAVQSGRAQMALLVPAFSIEQNARRGILLPPKSTDFFPKLAAGLILHRH